MEYLDELYDLCEVVSREIKEANNKIHDAGGKLSAGDVDYIDKLTHTLKSIKATIAMVENEDEYSNRGGSYNMDGGSYNRGGSYARGRGQNARRDSRGRYSRERGYSRDHKELSDELNDMIRDVTDERTRQKLQRFAEKLEDME